jgi:YfiH family protein
MDILKPNIFYGKNVIAGVTKVNKDIFPPYGFSITNADIYNDCEINEQRKFLADFLKVDFHNMIFHKQIHSDIVKFVDENYVYGESDALITNIKGKILNISLADCQGILIYDEENQIAAGVHSGWQGTKQNIAGKTIKYLIENFNSNPENLFVYITPAASGKNYEVGDEFLNIFPDSIITDSTGKLFFDNPNEVYQQLINEGVKVENIEKSEICTIDNLEYHSFRRDKELSGRMSAFIGMI